MKMLRATFGYALFYIRGVPSGNLDGNHLPVSIGFPEAAGTGFPEAAGTGSVPVYSLPGHRHLSAKPGIRLTTGT